MVPLLNDLLATGMCTLFYELGVQPVPASEVTKSINHIGDDDVHPATWGAALRLNENLWLLETPQLVCSGVSVLLFCFNKSYTALKVILWKSMLLVSANPAAGSRRSDRAYYRCV